MKKVTAIVVYDNKDGYKCINLSVHGNSFGLVQLLTMMEKCNNLRELYDAVLYTIKINGFYVKSTKMFDKTWYDIVWININDPQFTYNFYYTEGRSKA